MAKFITLRENATIDQLELRSLLADIKKSVELWFLVERSRSQILKQNETSIESHSVISFEQIQATCTQIMRHGLQMLGDKKNSSHRELEIMSPAANEKFRVNSFSPANEVNTDAINKLVDDFEWVRRSAQIRDSLTDALTSSLTPPPPYPSITSSTNKSHCIEYILSSWILRNLKANCLCSCLQALVTDKELLHYYYADGAFLRCEAYATSLFICLSALELNQYSLLSQIDAGLYCTTTVVSGMGPHDGTIVKHKRSSSHPNFSISPPKKTLLLKENCKVNETMEMDVNEKTSLTSTQNCLPPVDATVTSAQPHTVFPTFRKIKSLPAMQCILEDIQLTSPTKARQRSKTITTTEIAVATHPRTIPKMQERTTRIASSLSSSSKSEISNFTMHSNSPAASVGSTSAISAISPATTLTTTATASNIEIINCDDIKIWTDQSYEQQNQNGNHQSTEATTESYAIPENALSVKQTAKSISPINSFLCSLFSTPPSYTSWAINQSSHSQQTGASDIDATAAAAIYPCNTSSDGSSVNNSNSGGGGGVFDSFLPVYGQKLRSRKSQNLFEDSISSITTPTSEPSEINDGVAADAGSGSDAPCKSNTHKATTQNCQSLTAFLQMSQHSRNNTELERENAHFRISEAIISAIEHMKWAKLETKKYSRKRNEATTAIDWLQNEQQQRKQHNQHRNNGLKTETEVNGSSNDEYITYAEVSEIDLGLPSAEAVGLSLISKFNDKHLPKVSELKWLVSDEDTPQKLLPMPDQSPTANPDENIVTPMTRGTKYWAPPRQQIIFTDHPQASRKEQLQKQNNRCAGCGMRVAPQYVHSFRYCTYLGKYHCTGCHRNQISAIPAKILQAWDFKCYPVSAFAYHLLEQMYTYPLFYVPDLNPALYVRSKPLLAGRNKRVQLKFVKDFVKACRFATREQKYFDAIPDYITEDTDIWSMSDFIDVQDKSMQRSIEELVEKCENHIFNCVLCNARGFLCEYCKKDQIIYPWQKKTFRCDLCGSCFHLNCWKSMLETCCRCQRFNKRQDDIAEI